ncbi:ABC transporter [Seiridium cupressi]
MRSRSVRVPLGRDRLQARSVQRWEKDETLSSPWTVPTQGLFWVKRRAYGSERRYTCRPAECIYVVAIAPSFIYISGRRPPPTLKFDIFEPFPQQPRFSLSRPRFSTPLAFFETAQATGRCSRTEPLVHHRYTFGGHWPSPKSHVPHPPSHNYYHDTRRRCNPKSYAAAAAAAITLSTSATTGRRKAVNQATSRLAAATDLGTLDPSIRHFPTLDVLWSAGYYSSYYTCVHRMTHHRYLLTRFHLADLLGSPAVSPRQSPSGLRDTHIPAVRLPARLHAAGGPRAFRPPPGNWPADVLTPSARSNAMAPPIVVSPAEEPLETFRNALQYAYPAVLLFAFVIVGATDSILNALRKDDFVAPTVTGPGGKPLPVTKRKREIRDDGEHEQYSPACKSFFRCCMMLATFTFFCAGANVAARALYNRTASGGHGWWCGEPKTVYILGSAFLYLYVTVTLFDWTASPYLVHIVLWCIAFIGDLLILVSDIVILMRPHNVMVNLEDSKYLVEKGTNSWDDVDLSLAGLRLGLLAGMITVYYAIAWLRKQAERSRLEDSYSSDVDESTPLINSSANGYHSNGHARNGVAAGTNGTAEGTSAPTVDEEATFYRPEKLPHTTWFEYLRGYSVFFPYMWPSKHFRLQAIVVVCFILLILQRIVNVMVPVQIAHVTNELSGDYLAPGEQLKMPWASLGLLILYKLLQGPSGLLGSFRSLIWIPVSQHSYRALTTSAFEHVHSLSLDFHLGKRTGEVLSALNKGSSVNSFLEQVTFQVFPMLIDLFLAISYFFWQFDAVYAVFVCIITFYYLFLTIRMAQSTADQRRLMSNADREEEAVKNDSIISYETVKYFNAEEFEFNRYRDAIKNFQAAEAKVTWSISSMNICQSLVFMTGMLIAMMLGAYQVSTGQRKVGDFVALMTYLNQLQGPLNFFGTFYRTVQQAMISGERLLELFKQQPTVVDRPGAKAVTKCDGLIEFSKVQFAYDPRRPALRDLSFKCQPGTTTALVGESGGGKSTLFRLLYRYFNSTGGIIKIDGQDIKDVTIDSVRRHIGVVPQDTILFNDTLMYNLRYANQNASEKEIVAACEAASIHERIMSFPDGYYTKVGERGLRLSGGEKQRVAIARTLLKNPKVIMLDEATSALDTQTEQEIQSRLTKIGHGRTLLIIAHRLSTITHADQILVLKNGSIIERGTHEGLLEENKVYAKMWSKQAKAQKAAQDAFVAQHRAEKYLRKASLNGNGQDDDSSSSSDESTRNHQHRQQDT